MADGSSSLLQVTKWRNKGPLGAYALSVTNATQPGLGERSLIQRPVRTLGSYRYGPTACPVTGDRGAVAGPWALAMSSSGPRPLNFRKPETS
jgi:hypothetical protein